MLRIKHIYCAFAVVAMLAAISSSDGRPWKDSAGKRTVEAEFVSLVDGKVTLKRSDGKLVTMALDKLSSADQKVARELAAAAPKPDAVPIELVGLAISKPVDSASGLMSTGMMMSSGTSLTFIVPSGDRHFVGFDSKASQITKCQDDQGNDLNASQDAASSFGSFGPFNATVSEDGKMCQIAASLPGVPAHGAVKINFEATVVILCGADEKTEEQKDVAMEAGSEITVGPVPLKIESAQAEDFGDTKFAITLNSTKPRDAIKSIEFVGDEGEVIEHQSMGGGSFGFGDEMTYQTSYGLKKAVDKVTVRITYYSKVETYTVPVKIETGVGL